MFRENFAGQFLTKDKILSRLSPLYKRPSTRAIIEQQVLFSDVSFYQGIINWDIMATKSPAVIIRAGQNTWVDTKFSRNYSEAKRVGMKRGVYWFYDSRIHPITQANILIGLLRDDLPEMEIFCDWEYDYGGSYLDLSHAVDFMQHVESNLANVRVGMYTGFYFFKDHSSPTNHATEYDYLKNKPLWLAWYTTNPAYVQIPLPWTRLTHWQWTSSGDGKGWGTETNGLDLNWFNGTITEFNQRYSGVTPPEPPEPPTEPEEPTHIGTVIVGALNIRNGASTAYDIIGALYQGDTVYGVLDTATNWMHISSIHRVNGNIEVIDGWASASSAYMSVSEISEPPIDGEDMLYSNGVRVRTGRANGSNYRQVIIPPSSVRSKTYDYVVGTCRNVESVEEYDAVFNFTPFYGTCRPNLGLRIAGTEYEPYHNYNPYLSLANPPVITHVAKQFRNHATVSQAFRYIVENGVKNPNYNSDWDNLEPRRLVGLRENGTLVIVSVKGRDENQRGWTLHEAADFMLSRSCVVVIDGDSGSSVQDYLVINGEKKLFYGVPVSQRSPVAVFLGITFTSPLQDETVPPPDPDPDPEVPTVTHEIDVYSDGKISVDNGDPF